MATKISLKDLSLKLSSPAAKGYNTIFEDFNIDIEGGGITIFLGPSGCGKSTLLNIINGLLQPTEVSSMSVNGEDIRDNPEVTRQMAYVFQEPRLLRWKTLAGNARYCMRGLKTQPKHRWQELIEKYFAAAGLSEYMDHYPHQVSGGMQQRAAIVRAWVNEPEILLMDEPFSHLDEITAAEMRRLLIQLWQQDEHRRTILFVTHDISEAVQLASDIVVLTQKPSNICYRESIDMPWPRPSDSDEILALEQKLRQIFTQKIGVRI